jgi:hypothetical protein
MPMNGSKQGNNPRVGSSMTWTRLGSLVVTAAVVSAVSVLADTPNTGSEPKLASPKKATEGKTVGSPKAVTSSNLKKPGGGVSPSTAADRVALSTSRTGTHVTLKPDLSSKPKMHLAAATPEEESIARAIRTIKGCQARFENVSDYTCIFYKRERIDGQLTPQFIMMMKARTKPKSIYFKFEEPYRGREAIYVEGRNSGRILAHDVGFTKFLAGTMELEPTSSRAMEENRHPITEAGIGTLIDTVARRWAAELSPDESVVVFDSEMMIGPRRCLMVESIHPRRQPGFFFYKVRLFIDSELNLPIRFEGYDWPKEEGVPAELVEEYSYINLRLNVGLGGIDFDTANRLYSFGRF